MSTRGPYESKSPGAPPRSLAERIRGVRLAWGWTQGEMGAALNTDQTAVSAWERDKARPSGAALAALANLYGVTPESLESGEGFQPHKEPGIAPPTPGPARFLRLPDPGIHPALVVDLQQGEDHAVLDTQDAILRLIQAAKDGRKVWVVLE